MTQCAISIKDLHKEYAPSKRSGAKVALKSVDLEIKQGEMFALLGPNGAGKSTLINILAGIISKTSGLVSVLGCDLDKDPRGVKMSLGVVPQEVYADPFFTPRKILDLQSGFFGVPKSQRKTDEILQTMGLSAHENAYTMALSGGMKRRLMVAKAMVHSPPILILDEPTAGVDISLRKRLWDTVRALNAAGTTIILTTHYLEEAQSLCERVAILDKGNIVACKPTEELLSSVKGKEIKIRFAHEVEKIPQIQGFSLNLSGKNSLIVRYNPQEVVLGKLLEEISKLKYEIKDISTRQSELEEVFLQLTGGEKS